MNRHIEPNITEATGRLPDEFRRICRQQRERKLREIRAQVKGGTYETAAKLDEALEVMIDAEGFDHRARDIDAELREAAYQREVERVIDYGGSHRFQDSAVYRDGQDLAGE